MAKERAKEPVRLPASDGRTPADRLEFCTKLMSLLDRMTPEDRALFERIVSLRQESGPAGFDIVEALRELRES